jgi:hypothetical protein
MRALCLASLVAILALAPAAHAQRIDLISDGAGEEEAFFDGASDDGSRVIFSTEDPLAPSDTDAALDLYAREPNGALTHLTDGMSQADGNFEVAAASISKDGARVLFTTAEPLLASDTDTAHDVYEAGPGGLRHVSDDPTGADDNEAAIPAAGPFDGARAFFMTVESLTPDDTDTQFDVYESGAAGGLTLVSDDDAPGTDPNLPAMIGGVSDDGSRVFVRTSESFAAADTDVAADIYGRGPGGLTLLSDGVGLDSHVDVEFVTAPGDGARLFFSTGARLALSDEDDAEDVYAHTSPGGLVHVSDGAGPDAEIPVGFVQTSDDGTRAFFQTTESLLATDTDDAFDAYGRGPEGLSHPSDGLVDPDPNTGSFLRGVSSDGSRVFFQTADPLLPGDDDVSFDVYERGPAGVLALVSDDAGELDAGSESFFSHASRDGGRVTFETEERLAVGDTDDVVDVYQRTPGGALVHLTDSPSGTDAEESTFVADGSSDGRRLFFATNESMVAADVDDEQDIYAATLPPDPLPGGPGPEQPPSGGGTPPPGRPPPDTTRPALSRVRLARTRFAGRTELRFRLSEPATVRLRIERALPGRRVGRSCRAPSRRNRGRRRCTRYAVAGRRTIRARAGTNAVPLRADRPGAYRLTLTAVDAAGNVSRRARLPFTVVAGKRRR